MQTKETSSFAYDVLDIKESRNWLKNKQCVKLSVTKSKTHLANFWHFKMFIKLELVFFVIKAKEKTVCSLKRTQDVSKMNWSHEHKWKSYSQSWTHSFYSKLRMDLSRNWLKLSSVITVWAKWNAMYENKLQFITISSSYVINKTFPWGNKKKIFFHYFKAAWTPLVSSQLHQF